MPTLKGTKVNLRTIEKKDIPSILQWFNDAEVIQFLQFYLPLTEMAEEKWFEKMSLSEKDVTLAIDAKKDDETTVYIGNCGLHGISAKDHSATLGIAIGEKEYWSGGLGTEAVALLVRYGFEQLNLHRISSFVYSFNERSLKMHLKVGFQEEGCSREAVFKNGQYWDIVRFGLLRKEWKK